MGECDYPQGRERFQGRAQIVFSYNMRTPQQLRSTVLTALPTARALCFVGVRIVIR